MNSRLADDLDRARRAREADATPAQRVALALALGQRDLRRFAAAQGLSMEEARRELRRSSQHGRTPSKVMQEANG
jgi:hypothetical protein